MTIAPGTSLFRWLRMGAAPAAVERFRSLRFHLYEISGALQTGAAPCGEIEFAASPRYESARDPGCP